MKHEISTNDFFTLCISVKVGKKQISIGIKEYKTAIFHFIKATAPIAIPIVSIEFFESTLVGFNNATHNR